VQSTQTFSQDPEPALRANDISIAVTLYNREDYIVQAVESALAQTQKVQVFVVEDCGPDPKIGAAIRARFGDQIRYHRNPTRRGLFGNWNICIELCRTPWLSILHDDDYLAPEFVEAMVEAATLAPNCGIYFSEVVNVNARGQSLPSYPSQFSGNFRRLDVRSLAYANDVLFPGQLFRVECAKKLGGFRESSQFCGDWEMWFKIAYFFGAAQTNRPVAFSRSHEDFGRGTNKVVRTGRKHALDYVQAKRNVALLRRKYPDERFDRKRALAASPLPTRTFFLNAKDMSPRLLRYNVGLLSHSQPPNSRYLILQKIVRLLGPNFVRIVSSILRRTRPQTK